MKKTITFIQICPVAADGIHVKYYKRGESAEFAPALADALVKAGLATAGKTEEKKLPSPKIAPEAERVNLMEVGKAAVEPKLETVSVDSKK